MHLRLKPLFALGAVAFAFSTIAVGEDPSAAANYEALTLMGLEMQSRFSDIAISLGGPEIRIEHRGKGEEKEGKHGHYYRHMKFPFTNPHNFPNPPASIDVTVGPKCECDEDFDTACATNKKIVEDMANKKFSFADQFALNVVCRTRTPKITPCPTTPGEAYGGGPFECLKEQETIEPIACLK